MQKFPLFLFLRKFRTLLLLFSQQVKGMSNNFPQSCINRVHTTFTIVIFLSIHFCHEYAAVTLVGKSSGLILLS